MRKPDGGTPTIIHESANIDWAELDKWAKKMKKRWKFKMEGILIPHVDFLGTEKQNDQSIGAHRK